MSKVRVAKPQTAQGIVEFALVLPILLMVIFGIFAFGHLIFSYISVVSASREAARWGSAAGVSESMRPRYSDCDSIRAAAVRVGGFAGVAAVDSPDENTPGIAISFDHGPNDPNPDYDDCSDGLGAGVVGYGDRINVRVTVMYRPIVPFVNIPTFPLTATTSRTIIKSLPVGEAPAVEASCPTTTIILETMPYPYPEILPAPPEVNQRLDVRVRVIASDGSSPTGVVDLVDHDPNDTDDIHTCRVQSTSAEAGRICSNFAPYGYESTGVKYLTALYDNRGTCFQPSELINEPFQVIKGNTIVEITSDNPDPSWPWNPVYNTGDVVLVEFRVRQNPQYPGSPVGAIPSGGRVTVSNDAGDTWTSLPIVNGRGSVRVYLSEDTNLYATYEGDINFNPSPVSDPPEPHTIRVDPTPTPPDVPDYCPTVVGSMAFSDRYRAMQVAISNEDGGATAIESIELEWPTLNMVQLIDIRFGSFGSMGTCNTNPASGEVNCLWRAADPLNGLNPPEQTIDSSTVIWHAPAASLPAGSSKFLRFGFAARPEERFYYLTVNFSNGCVLSTVGEP